MKRGMGSLVMLGVLACVGLVPMPAIAGDPLGTPVTVPLDVDVYGTPEDDGTKQPQFLAGGSQVLLIEERLDHWCHVASGVDPVPGGSGWIWCGPADDGDYSVQPAGGMPPAEAPPAAEGGGD